MSMASSSVSEKVTLQVRLPGEALLSVFSTDKSAPEPDCSTGGHRTLDIGIPWDLHVGNDRNCCAAADTLPHPLYLTLVDTVGITSDGSAEIRRELDVVLNGIEAQHHITHNAILVRHHH